MKKLLLLLTILIGFSFSGKSQVVFSENWDGQGPGIAAWTLHNVDALTPNTNVSFVNNAWVRTPSEFDNNVAMSTSWYTPAGISDDWLVSPSITLPAGTNTLYWDGLTYDPTYPDSYRVYISITGTDVADFTEELDINPEVATGFTRHSLNLSAYSGFTIHIAFQNYSDDKYLVVLDNIAVINNNTCLAPNRDVTSTVTTTTATMNWTAVVGATGYDVAIGAPGFTPSVATGTTAVNTYTATGLTPNTRYQFYVRNSCGSNWIGPYSVFTANVLPYAYGFETTAAAGGYAADGWDGSWTLGTGVANAQAGTQFIFSNTSTTAVNNRSIFSRPISLQAGEQVTISFYHKETSATINRSLRLRVINQATPTVSTVIYSGTGLHTTTFTQITAPVFTAPSTGIYFFEFNDFSPVSATASSMVFDSVNMATNLATSSFNESKFNVYPNPTSNVINISSEVNAVISTVEMADMNGRIVKFVKVNATEGQISVSDLATGMYTMKITTDQGIATKKIVKQ